LLAKAGINNSNRPIPQTGAGIPSSTISLRTEREDGSHDQECEDHRIGGRVDKADLLGKADNDGAERGPRDRAHSTHDDDNERSEQEPRVFAR
jgi:hypothetical protein